MRRLAAWTAVLTLAAGCGDGGAEVRSLTDVEAQRLASVRLLDRVDRVARVSGELSLGVQSLKVHGWVDWRRPLVYLGYEGADHGLVQAIPGALVARAGTMSGDAPPLPAPLDGWRPEPAATPIGRLADVLLALTADRPDNPLLLRGHGAVRLRGDRIDGTDVDVFRGPGAAQPTVTTGRIRYWVDRSGRLRRLELPTGTIDFARGGQPVLNPVPALANRLSGR